MTGCGCGCDLGNGRRCGDRRRDDTGWLSMLCGWCAAWCLEGFPLSDAEACRTRLEKWLRVAQVEGSFSWTVIWQRLGFPSGQQLSGSWRKAERMGFIAKIEGTTEFRVTESGRRWLDARTKTATMRTE